MAAAETARLIASLELKDKLTPGARSAAGSVDRLDSKIGKLGTTAKRGASVAGKAIAGIGALAAIGVTAAIKGGIEDLAALEDATTAVDGAIKQTGQSGKVTSAQIAAWANEIETNVQAAFDDKAITAAAATLIRFGKVTTDNIRPAMEVMTDLAAKTGSVESASTLLAKALADPTKAAGKLARSGVILTKQQQKQIAAFEKAGKRADAQKVILDALAKTTGGAAADSVGKYGDAINLMSDASEDARKALAEGFFPVIERISGKITKLANDPKVIASLRDFGKGLAGAFDDAIDFAEKIDWGSIGNGLKVAADWAGKLIGAFTKMPPEAQAAIVGLAGLNKLSGGAVTGIVSELGKGLIKGVLGMTAGVVNLQAGVVNGAGGLPTGAAGTAGAAGAAGGVTAVISAAGAAAIGAAAGFGMKEAFKQVSNSLFPPELARSFQEALRIVNPLVGVADTLENIPARLGGIADAIKGIGKPANKPATFQNGFGAGPVNQGGQTKGWAAAQKAWVDNGKKITDLQHGAVDAVDASGKASVEAQGQAKREIANRVQTGAAQTSNAATGAGSRVTTQSIANTSRIVNGFRSIPAPITNVTVNVTGAQVTKSQTVTTRSSTPASRNDDRHNG